jgi:sugar phosphate isomerase/epimerase
MNISGHDIGVCSWSLRPKGAADLVSQLKQLDLRHVQLALRPLLVLDDAARQVELGHLRKSGVVLTAGMIDFPGEDYSSIGDILRTGGYAPDDQWADRFKLTQQAAELGHELGLTKITTHVGYVPQAGDEGYDKMRGRVLDVAAALGEKGISLGMETGQERAEELVQFLEDLKVDNVFVNFDPANMILYGAGDPIEAIGLLAAHVRHVHAKDGTYSARPGLEWGQEVPFGAGSVGPERFLDTLQAVGYAGPISIEREAGEQRFADVEFAIRTLRDAAPGAALPN